MHVALRYFSGTGNSYKILSTCNKVFLEHGCESTLRSITEAPRTIEKADLIGFCFPVYAFGIPRICRNYLRSLPQFPTSVDTFVLITAGDADEAGFSVQESSGILQKKGLTVVFSEVVQMPANWTVSMHPPAPDEAQELIQSGVAGAREIALDLLHGVQRRHTFTYPPRYSLLGFYKDYYLFKWLGVRYLWQEFRTDETCTSCGLCKEICPTQSIRMVDGAPTWSKTCEQCMRCVNYCPQKAIFQKGQGSIKGKNTYHEPTFNPLQGQRGQTPHR